MSWVRLTAKDGHELGAYRAEPTTAARGGVVVVHEIAGVNAHIRDVTDRFAASGYLAIAPALFDRVDRGVELGYDLHALVRGGALADRIPWRDSRLDLQAAVGAVASAGRVGTVGFCYGGTIVWLAAASQLGLACAVSYYGSRISEQIRHQPRIPVLMHVARRDVFLPLDKAHLIAARYPEVELHEYEAEHGFNCDQRKEFEAASAALAFTRTLEFLHMYVDARP